jgi:TRAP-type uncharacterized transport system fused permease subunit
MMVTWKYTLPAFLVPFVFTLQPDGMGVLLVAPPQTIVLTSLTAAAGVGSVAIGAGGWLRRQATGLERLTAVSAGLLLLYPAVPADIAGLVGLALAASLHLFRTRSSKPIANP